MKKFKKRRETKNRNKIGVLVFLLIILFALFILLLSFLIKEFLVEEVRLAPLTISACRDLNEANTEYMLDSDVSDADTCFTITAENVILNGQGHKVSYSRDGTTNQYGVVVNSGANFAKITDLVIEDSSVGGTSEYGIYVFNANNAVIDLVNISVKDSPAILFDGVSSSTISNAVLSGTEDGLKLTGSSNNVIDGVKVTTQTSAVQPADTNTRAIYIVSGSNYNKVRNANVVTQNINGFGVQVQGSSHNVFEDIVVNTNNDKADALRFAGADSFNNSFSRMVLKTAGASDASGILTGASNSDHSFVLRDSIVDASNVDSSDFQVSSSSVGGEWVFVNVSFSDKQWDASGKGVLDIYWHFDTKVVDSSNDPLEGVSVKGKDASGSEVFNEVTDSNGWIQTKDLLESRQIDNGNPVLFIPYTVEYSKSGYETDSDPIASGGNVYIPKELNDLSAGTPIITINAPKAQAYATNVSLELDFSVDDSDGLRECKYNFDNSANITDACSLNTTFNISAGEHTLYVFAEDNLGNMGSASVTFQAGSDVPIVVLNYPSDNAYLNYRNDIYLNYTPTYSGIISSCSLYANFNGTFVINQTSNVVNNGARNSFGPINLFDGAYKWNVLCTDSGSKANFALNNFTFWVDTTKPVIVNITSPAVYPSTILCSRTVSLEYNLNELNKDYCFYNVVNSNGGIIISDTNISGCETGSFNIGSSNEDTTLKVSLTAVDKAGNVGNTFTRDFYVDREYNSCQSSQDDGDDDGGNFAGDNTRQNRTNQSQSLGGDQGTGGNQQQTGGTEIKKISVEENASSLNISDGENVVFSVDGQEYNAVFEVENGVIKLNIGSGEYTLEEGEVISVSLGSSKLYIGAKNVLSDNASLVIGTDEDSVKHGFGNKRRTVFILVIIVVAILIVAIGIILFYIIKTSHEENMSERHFNIKSASVVQGNN